MYKENNVLHVNLSALIVKKSIFSAQGFYRYEQVKFKTF